MSTRAAIKVKKGEHTAWFYRHAEGHEDGLGQELLQLMDSLPKDMPDYLCMGAVCTRLIICLQDITPVTEEPQWAYYGYVIDLDAKTLKCYYLIDQAHPGWLDVNEIPIRRENGYVDKFVTVRRGNQFVLAYCAGIVSEGTTDYFQFITIGGERWSVPLREAEINLLSNEAAIHEVKCQFRKMAEKTDKED